MNCKNITILLILIFFIKSTLYPKDIVINKFMSSNSKSIKDENSDYEDWIVSYNLREIAINLKNDTNDKDKIVDSLIFSHKQGFYTKPFELKIINTSPDHTIYYTLDGSIPTKNSFVYKYPVKINYRYNEPNTISDITLIPDTFFKIFPFKKEFTVPIVSKATVIRVAAIKDSILSSKVYTFTFFVDTNIYSKYSTPVVSLVTDANNLFNEDTGIYVSGKYFDKNSPLKTGNYYQKGKNWERNVNVTLFKKNGDIAFSQGAGMRIHGYMSRKFPQKCFRLCAKEKYREEYFQYRLFPQKEQKIFKRFILKAPHEGKFALITDPLIHNIVKNLNLDVKDYMLVTVFINGEYWGIYTIRDRLNKYYLALKYNINKDSIDIIKGNHTIIEGNIKKFETLIFFVKDSDVTIQKNYDYIKSQIDIKSYIDHQITQIYFNCPCDDDYRFWRPETPNGKWRWFIYDMDTGAEDANYNTLKIFTDKKNEKYYYPNWSKFLFSNLLKNNEFKNQFINRFFFLINTTFSTDSILYKINEFEKLYEPEIKEHSNRWYGCIDVKKFVKECVTISNPNIDTINSVTDIYIYSILQLKDFARKRPYYMKKIIMEEFNLNKLNYNDK